MKLILRLANSNIGRYLALVLSTIGISAEQTYGQALEEHNQASSVQENIYNPSKLDISYYGIQKIIDIEGDIISEKRISDKLVIIFNDNHVSLEARISKILSFRELIDNNIIAMIGAEGYNGEFTTEQSLTTKQKDNIDRFFKLLDKYKQSSNNNPTSRRLTRQIYGFLLDDIQEIPLLEALYQDKLLTFGIEDMELYKEHKKVLNKMSEILSYISEKSNEVEYVLEVLKYQDEISFLTKESIRLTTERNRKYATNQANIMKEKNIKIATLHCGGDHSKETAEFLNELGVSTVIIEPYGSNIINEKLYQQHQQRLKN